MEKCPFALPRGFFLRKILGGRGLRKQCKSRPKYFNGFPIPDSSQEVTGGAISSIVTSAENLAPPEHRNRPMMGQ